MGRRRRKMKSSIDKRKVWTRRWLTMGRWRKKMQSSLVRVVSELVE
jgi:hypothetical protein